MRRHGDRANGYPSDLTAAQRQVIAPHLPAQVPGRRGRPRIWPLRRITEAILYLDRAGCAWRYLPSDFPPWPTVYGYFAAWRDDGTLARLHDALRAQVRAAAGRDREPTAAVIDSQSVPAADTVPKAARGWDAAKKVNRRKRPIPVDAVGMPPGPAQPFIKHSLRDLDGPDFHTPVVMAVRGPKARALAADLADTVTFAAMPGDDSRAGIMRMAADFRAIPDVELALHVPVVGDAVSPFMASPDTDPAALRAADSLLVLPSDPTAAIAEVLRRREEGGFSYIVVGANAADALAPVVAELTRHSPADRRYR